MSLMEMESFAPGLEVLDELAITEQRLAEEAKKEFLASYEIGRLLNEIQDKELYRLRGDEYKTFNAYLINRVPWDKSYSYRLQHQARVVDVLKKEGLELPKTAAILEALYDRLELEAIPDLWRDLLQGAQSTGTDLRLKHVVRAIEAMPTPAAPAEPEDRNSEQSRDAAEPRRGVNVDLDLGGGEPAGNGAPAAPEPPKKAQTFSDKGEEALERIGRLCGKGLATDIEKGRLPISERALKKWADEDDDTVRALKYYVADQGWSVEKALKYEQQGVTENLTLGHMISWASAHGGHWVRRFQGYRITLERV